MPYIKPIHLAIIDDQVLFRKTLANFLVEEGNIKVSVHASNVSELLYTLKTTTMPAVDVLLIDIFLPGLHPVDALKSIRCQHPDLKILVMSMNRDLNIISEMLEAGIHGYISKADEPDELLKAIKSVAVNHLFRNTLFTEALYFNRQNFIEKDAAGCDLDLNDREKKILQLLWEEKSNKEIAGELFLGVRSVEKIRQDLKEKVGVRTTVGLLKFAINKKIIRIHSMTPDHALSRVFP
jgi:DNA-binding NarL/FixJ family response regulator